MADTNPTPDQGATIRTLGEKVYGLLSPDLGPGDFAHAHPALPEGEHLSDRELDTRDWGLTFGLAFGIARGEDPYEPTESVGQRALHAAESAFRRMHGAMPTPVQRAD